MGRRTRCRPDDGDCARDMECGALRLRHQPVLRQGSRGSLSMLSFWQAMPPRHGPRSARRSRRRRSTFCRGTSLALRPGRASPLSSCFCRPSPARRCRWPSPCARCPSSRPRRWWCSCSDGGAVGTITLVAVMVFFPTFVACLHGLRQAPGQVMDVFDSYAAGPFARLVRVRIPAMLPAFFCRRPHGPSRPRFSR